MAARPLPPLPVPWTMKALASADSEVRELDDGRVCFSLVHEVLEGVTPRMLVWWLKNMDGDIEIGGRTMSRYRAWHPVDHVKLTYVRKAENGDNMGPGSRVRIEEFFGAQPAYRVDIVDDVLRLDEGGFVHHGVAMGREIVRMEYRFSETGRGTLYENSLTVGMAPGLLSRTFNRVVRPRVFPLDKGQAWLKHNVEEVGNLQFFLPRLYRDQGPAFSA